MSLPDPRTNVPVAILGAVFASALVAAFGPPSPLRSTAIVLPLIAVLLRWIGLRLEIEPGPGSLARSAAATVLWLFASLRGTLDLPAGGPDSTIPGVATIDALWVAMGAILLFSQVIALVAGLRRTPGTRWPFFFIPLLVYAALLPWSTQQRPPDGDEPWVLLLTHSLVHDFDLDLTNNYQRGDSVTILGRELGPQAGDPIARNGSQSSRHNALLSMVLAPFYLLAGVGGALFAICCLTAATTFLTYRLGRQLFPDHRDEAILAWATLAFTAPLLIYSYQAWTEVPAALLLLAALNLAVQPAPTTDRHAVLRSVALIALLVLMCLLKLRFAPVAGSAMVIAWWAPGIRRRHISALGIAFLAGLAAVAMINQYQWGNPLKYRNGEALILWEMPAADFFRGTLGLFFDSAFGLFLVAPIWLILVVALPRLWRVRPGLFAALVTLVLPYLIFIVPRGRWYGDWSPPFRYPLVLLPLLALAAIPILRDRQRPGPRVLATALMIFTALLSLAWIVVPGMTYSLADGTSTLLRWLNFTTSLDVGRFFPSYLRPRLASWLWPPIAILVVTLLWKWPLRLPRPRLIGSLLAGASLAALSLGVQMKPTRIIEVEDTWVKKNTGAPWPDQWNPARASFQGGWGFYVDTVMEARVVPGSGSFEVNVYSRYRGDETVDRPMRLEISAGDQVVQSNDLTNSRWDRHTFSFDAWEGEPILRIRTIERFRKRRVPIIDRIEMRWRSDAKVSGS